MVLLRPHADSVRVNVRAHAGAVSVFVCVCVCECLCACMRECLCVCVFCVRDGDLTWCFEAEAYWCTCAAHVLDVGL